MSLDYKSAGVDKEAGYRTVRRIREYAAATHNARVLGQIGAFGACYDLSGYREPVLVSGTDGVGTKLKVAFALERYDTIGIDAVAMCVNDILCHGARPQFFLDYLSCGELKPEVAADIVKGIAEGCRQSGAALIGGETAEMPGFYAPGEYDIAGFAVGVVEKSGLIDGSAARAGDILIGLPSSGFHSNGYSLLRKALPDFSRLYRGRSIGDWLLTATKIYVQPVLSVLERYPVHGMAHITGGGLPENLPRAFGPEFGAVVETDALPELPLIELLAGQIETSECFSTFNMGVGFVLIVPPEVADDVVKTLHAQGENGFRMGQLEKAGKEPVLFR